MLPILKQVAQWGRFNGRVELLLRNNRMEEVWRNLKAVYDL